MDQSLVTSAATMRDEGGWFTALRHAYARALQTVLRFRWLVLAGVAAPFVASMLLVKLVGTELFPHVDAGQIMIRTRATPGFPTQLTEKLTTKGQDLPRHTIPRHQGHNHIANLG